MKITKVVNCNSDCYKITFDTKFSKIKLLKVEMETKFTQSLTFNTNEEVDEVCIQIRGRNVVMTVMSYTAFGKKNDQVRSFVIDDFLHAQTDTFDSIGKGFLSLFKELKSENVFAEVKRKV